MKALDPAYGPVAAQAGERPASVGGLHPGPLTGLRVVEFAGKGPGPFAGMLLSDMGAQVTRVERVTDAGKPSRDLVVRGRRSLAVDLKAADGVKVVSRMIERADALIEGFRPGVMERLGLGPERCLSANEGLIYGRMTGWGQDGPMAMKAGHDINYIALSGALGLIGRAGQPPTPPLNLVGDLGGGGCLLAFGVVCGLLARANGGRGQVIDASMVEGSALLLTMLFGPPWSDSWGERGTNMIDSGAPFYDSYPTADGKWLAVGAIEPEFYENFVHGLGIDPHEFHPQMDKSAWPRRKRLVEARIRERVLDDWLEAFADLDACVSPVLELHEVAKHPHNVVRRTLFECEGEAQPAPAPRFSATPPGEPSAPPVVGAHTSEEMKRIGFSDEEIEQLLSRGVVAQA